VNPVIGDLEGESAHCKATAYAGTHNTERLGHTSIHRAGFEPAIPVFEWSKIVAPWTAWPLGSASFFPL